MRWVLLFWFMVAGCGATPPAPRSPQSRAHALPAAAPAAAPPRARYVPSLRAFSFAVGDARGFVGWGVRALLDSSGKVRFAGAEREDVGMRPVQVPAHLGGGWLFSGEHVAYAEEFLAPLRVTPVLSSGRDFEFGFDFVRVGSDAEAEFLSAPAFEPVARPTRLPLDAEHLAALDAQVGLVLQRDHTLRVSKDAGLTWAPTELGEASVDQLRRGPDALYLYTGSRLVRFEPNGGLRLMPRDAPEPWSSWQDSPLDSAARDGLRLNATQALLPQSPLQVVELDSGRARSFHVESNRNGGACDAVSGVDGGVLSCSGQIISNAIGRPLHEREVETNALLAKSAQGALLFRGPCTAAGLFGPDGAPTDAVQPGVCVRHVGGRWDSYALPAAFADGSGWPLALRPDDTVVGLALVENTVTSFDIPSGRAVPLQVPPNVDWGPRAFDVLGDDRLCVWSEAARSTIIDSRGALDWRDPGFEVMRWGHAGPRGLALSKDGKAFETQSCGASWTEVQPPPGPWAGAPVEPCQGPEKLSSPSQYYGPQCSFACSEVGCAVEPFVRIGWELSR